MTHTPLPVGTARPATSVSAALLLAVACAAWVPPVVAAQVLAIPSHADQPLLALATWSSGDVLLWLEHDGTPGAVEMPAGLRAEAFVRTDGLGLVVVGAGRFVRLRGPSHADMFEVLGGAPKHVRAAVKLADDRVVVISGGRFQDGDIGQAEASLWQLSPRVRKLWDGPGPRVNPRCLTAGVLAGRHSVLIGVDKTAIFDPVFRMRPWIYHADNDTLSPLWKGTSFSQPYTTALLADMSLHHPHDEVCSLELTADGQRQITVYRWHGFVMEGIAQSAADRYGDQLRQAGPAPDRPQTLFAWQGGDSGRIVGLRVSQWPRYQVAELQVCCATATIPRPLAWDVAWTAEGAAAYTLSQSGALMIVPFGESVKQ